MINQLNTVMRVKMGRGEEYIIKVYTHTHTYEDLYEDIHIYEDMCTYMRVYIHTRVRYAFYRSSGKGTEVEVRTL